jgi:hypothetical protein
VDTPALLTSSVTSEAAAAAAATAAGSVMSSCSTSTPGRSIDPALRAVA